MDVLDVADIKDLSIDHQLRDDRVSDLSLFAILSVCACLDSLIMDVTLLRKRLNLTQCSGESVPFCASL